MAQDFVVVDPRKAELLARRASVDLVITTTEKVAAAARVLAPGTMKEKIRAVPSAGLGLVISDHPATMFVIYKTKPHVIKARKVGGYLKFSSSPGATDYTFVGPSPRRYVNHPGNQHPNNFLMKALEAAKF